MIIEIRVPDIGGFNGMTITKWVKETGDVIEKDEIIAEVNSDKALITINAPEAGIVEILVGCEEVQNDQLIARVNTAEYVNPKIKNNISPNDIIGR